MTLESKIEAILFWKGEPLSRKKLAEILNVNQTEINEGLEKLKGNLENRGIVLLEKDNEITLGTNPEVSKLIENLQKEELNRELSKASLETLSIVLYKDGANRAEIDYIRGVQSSYMLRVLVSRGLIARGSKSGNQTIYIPTIETLRFMGLEKIEDMPDYEKIHNDLSVAAKNSFIISE